MFNLSFDGYHISIENDQPELWRVIVDTPGGTQVREWRQSFDDAYERATDLIRAQQAAASSAPFHVAATAGGISTPGANGSFPLPYKLGREDGRWGMPGYRFSDWENAAAVAAYDAGFRAGVAEAAGGQKIEVSEDEP